MTDSMTIEISPTNRYLHLWVARWQCGGVSGATDPVPRDLLVERLGEAVRARLGELDRLHDREEEKRAG